MQSLISIDFPAPKMEPESAHVVSAVSVHWLQCGDCDAALQHDPGNIQHQDKSFSSWLAAATLSP